ncbi:MAG: LuxR C-terminal-related transcriptional regulator [Acidimicrobiales bacterium]
MTRPAAVGEELVRTKLVAPTLPGPFVTRSRLHHALDAAVDGQHRLVLVSAPAGSGKSTLLAGWLAERSEPVAWLQVEASDADAARFWSYVLAALGQVQSNLEESLRPLVASAGGDATPLVSALANALGAMTQHLVLVVDDYHLIDNDQVHAAVERLIELSPAQLTVVIATRVDPPFRLGQLRVRNQLTEIRASDLRFDQHDARPLLGGRATEAADVVRALVDRTEGWAAGLVLAGVSMESADSIEDFIEGFQGNDQLIMEYLSDELLAAMAETDRQRMVETSVLERLTGPLVDAVSGTGGGGAWLRRTAAANQLLIGLDRSGTWYRYHHLLRDLLRLEAASVLGDRVAELHLAAANWHFEHGSLHDAVEHYLAGGDLDAAADLIADNATQLLNGGQLYTVLRYLDRVGDVIEQHSGCCIVRGWTTFFAGRFAEAEEWLDRARQLDVDGVDAGLIAALTTMIHVANGNVASGLEVATASPEPSDPSHAMTNGGVLVWAGHFDEARPHLQRAAEMAALESGPDDFAASVTPVFEAIIEIESANPSAADRIARAALAYAEEQGTARAAQMALAHSVKARTTTDTDEALDAVRRGVKLARRSPENIMLAYALVSAADVLRRHDDPEAAVFLREARTIVDRCPDPGIVGLYLARIEARQGIEVAAPKTSELVEGLTDREYAVLRLLPSRLSQRDIASELFVSLNTVKTHCRAIYRKLGVGDRKTAVQAARDLELL